MTTNTSNGVTTITAGEGKRLTNGETIAVSVMLGANDSASNWSEITTAEANIIEAAMNNPEIELPQSAIDLISSKLEEVT